MSSGNFLSVDDGPDDGTLVAEFKRTGAAANFEILFNRYGKRLYGVAWRLYRNADLAEECVQETFRRAIQQIGLFGEGDREHNFWAWLATIARDVCLSDLRRNRTRMKLVEQTARAGAPRPPISQDQRLMISELLDLIRTLPRRYRVCFLLLFVEGCTYEEIAAITGYTREQVRAFVQTARRHVRRRFGLPAVGPQSVSRPRAAVNFAGKVA
jgi:RNA polymerase sigma-70 factor, ECF subfamily